MLKDKCQHCNNLELSKELILFGVKHNVKTDTVIDFIFLQAKFFIYKCKLQESHPNLKAFLAILKNRYAIEKYLSVLNYKAHKFEENWLPYQDIIT